jgi:hypothetical protein
MWTQLLTLLGFVQQVLPALKCWWLQAEVEVEHMVVEVERAVYYTMLDILYLLEQVIL